MDQPETTDAEVEHALSDLEWTNKWLGGRSALMPYVAPLISPDSAVLDVACGSGDMMRALSEIKVRPHLIGLDINLTIARIARKRCRGYSNISFVIADARSMPFGDDSFDIVYSSIFLHHLSPDDVRLFFRECARVARRRVVIADLVRNDLAFMGVWLIGRLAFGRVSRFDGSASFRRAYTPAELHDMAESSGLLGAHIFRHGFYRMVLVYDMSK